MTELDRGRVAALAGFATTAALLALTVVAFFQDTFAPQGWRGGEYAYAFIWIALGSAVAGGVVRLATPPPWRSAGSGMIIAGAAGVLVVIALVVVFIVALSTFTAP